MGNKFIIITTIYNVGDWLPMNLQMMKYQSHKNWECILIDDHSTDNSLEIVKNVIKGDNRFTLIQTDKPRSGQGSGFLQGINYVKEKLNDEDIITEVDGDDWLSSVFVLQYLNEIYKNKNTWMTYGQYQMYPTGEVGGHWNMTIDNEVNSNNTHRYHPFPYSHLKTYKYWLFNKIDRQDLIDPSTNKVWRSAWDHALCLPMVEMAGSEHIHKCDDILYVLNRSQELENEGKMRTNEQKQTEQSIRQGKIYDKL